ncbi:class-II fumarase/aspartase family protein [Streptomyces neyagawaensis]|uniref:class-II fumarase/aspartase family protein n=2 Tax=Streptomyces neyagawaensis TaxID=42238 RepID=UPI00201CF2E3|nr:adenylosuccinate lyase family protein [Streptomyces neyagawaensis]MCL6733680.1 adenylosuccinate lyase family protein [Streptomyces neyagawaensis]MDE1683909.1 adenylosuccinate lyase family protein [Streptomyces neyagawaensis]
MSVGTDAGLLAPTWAGTPVAAEATDEAWLQAMLDAEVALARAQHAVGLTPAAAVEAIASVARTDRLDLVALAHAARAAANPVVALVTAFTEVVAAKDAAAAEYVHRGSTSQDILDSAAMLVARRVLGLIAADLDRTAAALAALADTHRHTVLAGRTLAQHAVPTTFGLKAAGWLRLVADALARVRAVGSTLPAQLGGAAGTLAAYREYAALDRGETGGRASDRGGVELLGPFAEALGLAEPVLPWHTVRTPVAELGAVLQLVTGALGKFALDVQTLSRTEIGEVSEPAAAGRGASSAMPQKRNPALATLIVAAARQVPAHALVLAQCLLAEDERPAGAWHAEWQPLREALRLAGGAAHTAVELAEGLIVHPDRMRANLELTGGALVTERLAVALAPVLGKVRAKKLLTAASAEAADTGRTINEVLSGHPELSARFTPAELSGLLDPARYTGAADALVDRALRAWDPADADNATRQATTGQEREGRHDG